MIKLLLSLIAAMVITTQAQPALGVYDYAQTFTAAKNMSYEQIWDWWDTCDYPGWLLPQLRAIEKRGRTPIVCVEPWPISSITQNKADLLSDIIYGKYDNVIRTIAADIKKFNAPVIVRWGHEMEATARYPWACNQPSAYIPAFQHVSAVFKNLAPNISMMWSPVGNPGCQNYYPGTAAVDYVGLSIYELPAASRVWYGAPQSFTQLMNMKYPLVSGFNKPVFVAELGDATTDNQAAWVAAMFVTTRNYPLLKALIWFNAQDTASWGPQFGTPDWRISPAIF